MMFKRRQARGQQGRTTRKRFTFERMEPRLLLDAGPLLISEFSALNSGEIIDEDERLSDWIEIHNPTPNPVDLDGWYLTDDEGELTKWEFPRVAIDAGDYLVVFASGSDRHAANSELHTNFELSQTGEYLALLRPDGETVSHQFASDYPPQFPHASYGLSDETVSFLVSENAELAYLIPSENEASLETSWTMPGFDDSAWIDSGDGAPVLITEVCTALDDYVEVQNVAQVAVDTTGWILAVSDSNSNINVVNQAYWDLPDLLEADSVHYATEDPGDNYFARIRWSTSGSGWALLMDDEGDVADFVVWGFDTEAIDSFDVVVNGHQVTAADIWSGLPVPKNDGPNDSDSSLQRTGAADHDSAADFAFMLPTSLGVANDGLITPFASEATKPLTGIGFDASATGVGAAVSTDIASAMLGNNASAWIRIPFDVQAPSRIDDLTLRMQYNDGFVAYLNGEEIARRNAPEHPAWDSAAVNARTVGESLTVEVIDVSAFAGGLIAGENVLAIHGLNADATDGDFLILPELRSEGTRPLGFYFPTPTPGLPNGSGLADYVRDTKFSEDRGFFDEPFSVTITTKTPEADIHYTLDGTAPSATNGSVYTGPLTIDQTTTLRAVALKDGLLRTNVDTQTYVFVDDVVTQPQMDRDVIGPNDKFGGVYATTIRDDLKAIPTLSLVMKPSDFSQIYNNPGAELERPTSVEYFDPKTGEMFQVDAGVEIHGANASTFPKKPFKLNFRAKYGAGRLDFPLHGEDELDRYDQLVLRSSGHDSWISPYGEQGLSATYLRDEFLRRTQLAMGHVAAKGTFVHLYINGEYWGLYNATERINNAFGADYFGGDQLDYDIIKSDSGSPYALQGNMSAWNAMMALVRGGLSADGKYEAVQEYLDMDNFIDFMIDRIWAGDVDWLQASTWSSPGSRNKNWSAVYNRVDPEGRFQFFVWDAEISMGKDHRPARQLHVDMTGANRSNSPGEIYQKLRASEEFRMHFADSLQRHFFNGGVMSPDTNTTRWRELVEQIDEALVAESARWGDSRVSNPYTRDVEWQSEIEWMEDVFFQQRNGIVVEQFRDVQLFPDLDAPVFSQHGGELAEGATLEISDPNADTEIYFTLDGSDPRATGGSLAAGAKRYGDRIAIEEAALVTARVYEASTSTWSAATKAQFLVFQQAGAGNFHITELNYNPYPPTTAELATQAPGDVPFASDDFEFIELANVGLATIDLTGAVFTEGIDFDFSASATTTLTPGERIVIVSNAAAFAARYGEDMPIAGVYSRGLSRGGERLTIVDRQGNVILDFSYDDSGAWPGRADGKGSTLEVIDATGNFTSPANWRSSSEFGGSPTVDGKGPMTDIVVNEVLTRTNPGALDAIELYNMTDQPIDVGGWYLSDSWGWESDADNGNYRKYRIVDGTMIAARGYLVLDESDFNPSGGLDPLNHPNDFALDGARGDDVWLMAADENGRLTRFVDHAEFPASEPGVALGRWPDGTGTFFPMTAATLGGPNAGPVVGDVILSEVYYFPPIPSDAMFDPGELEFVELYNRTSLPIDLGGWSLAGGIDFDFAPETVLSADATLLVVNFDLTDTAAAALFHTVHDIDDAALLVGPYGGRLDNGGEQVRLRRPGQPPLDDLEYTPAILVDEVRYDDDLPWPTDAAGLGASLQRVAVDAFGNRASSWFAAQPTPGMAEFSSETAEVVGHAVFYNNSRFDGRDPTANGLDDAAIAPDKQALLPGETATFANYTSYCRGLNGIMLDIAALADSTQLTADDFRFSIGTGQTWEHWTDAPLPESVRVRAGEGIGGSDRISLIWDDGVLVNNWLRVTVLASPNTGLAEEHVFYYGNVVGETGNSVTNAMVTVADEVAVRSNGRGLANRATIDDLHDFNRDGLVSVADRIISRRYRTEIDNAIQLITPQSVDGLATAEMIAADEEGRGSRLGFEWIAELSPQSSTHSRAVSRAAAVDQLLATFWQ